jgi:hypothetical protein
MPIFTGAINSNWGTAGNWDTGVLPSATGAGSDAIFNASSPNCTVNITTAVCRNLNFTGYTNTITMTNVILVGSAAAANPNHSVTLSPTMGISGTNALVTRANGTTTLTSNGRVWPNTLTINTGFVAANSIATITDNWTVGSLVLGPGNNHVMTLQGAFTITVNGDFSYQSVGNVSRVNGNAAALTTIKLAGTGTWSVNAACTFITTTTSIIGFGVSIVIDTPGTITIGNNCCFGGSASVAGTNFTYVSGTVIHTGTFHLLGNQAGNGYSINLNGSSSTSATTTSSTGVNFNNLQFTTFSAGASPGACAITGNVCVVGNLTTVPLSATKAPILTSGGNIYVNGNFSHFAGMRVISSTVVVLQGTSVTYSEANASTAFIPWGTAWQVQINTTGSVNISTIIGFRDAGSLTYTAGTVTFSPGASILAGQSAAFYGFGSAGITIPAIEHNTLAPGVTFGTLLFFYDTVPFRVLTFNLTGATVNFTFTHKGTIGWDCDSLTCILQSGSTGSAFRLLPSVEYKIRTSLTMLSWAAVPANGLSVISDPSTASTIFTLLPGASQDLFYVSTGTGGGDVNSSNGQTIYTRGGFISTGTQNWRLWDYPRTRHSTFISN